jgi:RNA polymerase sigma-70 factor (ECF subfamily)
VPTEENHKFVAALARTHTRKLQRFLTARLRNAAADVPDLMQEVFLRLLRVKDHEAIRNPQAYVYTIASHVLHQHALKEPRRPEGSDVFEAAAELEAAAEPDPAEELEIRQRIERICQRLEAVSPRACAALLMYRCEGLTLQEIGDRLGVSRPMAKRYLLRAIAHCDEHLHEKE